jgi:hypothetical protein
MAKTEYIDYNIIGVCDICRCYITLMYAIPDSNIKICGNCYTNIPDYVPREQDSQYRNTFRYKRKL